MKQANASRTSSHRRYLTWSVRPVPPPYAHTHLSPPPPAWSDHTDGREHRATVTNLASDVKPEMREDKEHVENSGTQGRIPGTGTRRLRS